MIRYRRPKQDDPHILRLIETELVPYSHLSQGGLERVRRDLPKRLTRGVTLVISPYYEADLTAFIHFMLHGNLVFIDMLAVTSAQQRKRCGRTLLAQAENFAMARGCNRSKVMVDAGNDRALLFYKKSGYHLLRYIPVSQCYELEKMF